MSKPQYIEITSKYTKYFSDKAMTILHREDGPAIECSTGTKYWYKNGLRHREDGHAVEYAAGTKCWYKNGKLHREDGPAIIFASGTEYWYENGKLHREDGPAVEFFDGTKDYFLDNCYHTKEEFDAKMNPVVELTLEDIAAKFGVDVKNLKIKN